MDKQTLDGQIGRATGILIRLEQDLSRAKGDLDSATRNLAIGGVIALIGILAFIIYALFATPYTAALAAASLFIGILMVSIALVKIQRAQRPISTATDGIAEARAKLDGLKAQLPVAE